MKSFGVTWFIILLDKSTVIKDGLIGSPLNETNFLFEFTVPIFRFYVFENLSRLCSAPWLFSAARRNSFRVGVFWFRTSWWFPFYMFQLAPKRSIESASRQSWALQITKKTEGGCSGRMLKTRARQITKCLRNHKHPLAFEKSLHLGESREVMRQPHAKGDAGSKGRGKKRPPPFSRFRCTLARPLAINMLLIMTPVNASQN